MDTGVGRIALPTRLPRASSLGDKAGITDVARLNKQNRLGRMTRVPIPGIGFGKNGKTSRGGRNGKKC